MKLSISKLGKPTSWSTVQFSLPAVKTCPQAGQCKVYCYATKRCYQFPVVKAAYEANFQATRSDQFVNKMSAELIRKRANAVRIHASGDFYSKDYALKWIEIARRNPDKQFYAYTKMVRLFKFDLAKEIPSNFHVCFSFGGKQDNLIDREHDRHASIWNSLDEIPSDYVKADLDDSHAFRSGIRIGLKAK